MSRNHPDRLLLSLRDCDSDFVSDVEIPADMEISRLSTGLLRLLQQYEGSRYAYSTVLTLYHNERKLESGQTPASLGLWDGSELQFRTEPKKGEQYERLHDPS